MARVVRIALSALVVSAVIALGSGCAKQEPVFVDAVTAHTKTTALAVLERAESSSMASRPTADGTELRHDALAALRRQGATASAVADLLTRTFPSDTSGVPIYVERATYNGKPSVLVVEATGPESGSLSSKRLWVVAENGDILLAGSR